MAYASDSKAFGISDRSGFRFRLREMKREWTGALVGPDEFEPKLNRPDSLLLCATNRRR